MKHIISLGAGVQSSTMALMASYGKIKPMPDCAIFADTQAEPKAVYEWLDWLEKQLHFPVYRVSKGDLRGESLKIHTSKNGKPYMKANIPAYTINAEGKKGMNQRHCTYDFKIAVINRKVREILGSKWRKRTPQATVWMGISLDEADREKPSRKRYITLRHPLLYDVPMKRKDCLKWMKDHDYPMPPRSACTFCPFHSANEWLNLTREEFDGAVLYERDLQASFEKVSRFKGRPFLHKSTIPLDQIDLKKLAEEENKQKALREAQGNLFEPSDFSNECEGHCGI